jgi:hypothetical protein
MNNINQNAPFVKSRYMLLQICFAAYSKIQMLSRIIPCYENSQDLVYLRFSVQILREANLEYFRILKELNDLEILLIFNAENSVKTFEACQVKKSKLTKELNELNYMHPGFLFNLEESLYMFDFFDNLVI